MQILEVSVLLILITAPIGVFLIGAAGPKLLPRYVINDNTESEGKDPENAIEVSVWLEVEILTSILRRSYNNKIATTTKLFTETRDYKS